MNRRNILLSGASIAGLGVSAPASAIAPWVAAVAGRVVVKLGLNLAKRALPRALKGAGRALAPSVSLGASVGVSTSAKAAKRSRTRFTASAELGISMSPGLMLDEFLTERARLHKPDGIWVNGLDTSNFEQEVKADIVSSSRNYETLVVKIHLSDLETHTIEYTKTLTMSVPPMKTIEVGFKVPEGVLTEGPKAIVATVLENSLEYRPSKVVDVDGSKTILVTNKNHVLLSKG